MQLFFHFVEVFEGKLAHIEWKFTHAEQNLGVYHIKQIGDGEFYDQWHFLKEVLLVVYHYI